MDRTTSPGAQAEYHHCLFTAISLDAEWTRRSHFDGNSTDKAIDDACGSIRKRCLQYKARLERNRDKQKLRPPQSPQEIARWDSLYNPLEYVPLGHDDALSLVIFDDFAPLISITSRCPTTVEEVCLGYIPKLESLVAGHEETGGPPPWLTRARAAFAEPEITFQKEGAPTLPSLMVMSRFKVNGIGSLGMGSLHHVALMRALVRCIGETLVKMGDTVRGPAMAEGQALSAEQRAQAQLDKQQMEAFEISAADLASSRFMMVDLLGQEELGIIYFVPNWSIAAALNARLQSLTFAEVLQADATGRLKSELLQADWMSNLCLFYTDIQRDGAHPPLTPTEECPTPQHVLLQKIQAAHPLRWVRSTPAVRKDLFSAEAVKHSTARITGWIDATTHLRLAPGHQAHAKEITDEVQQRHELHSATPGILLPAAPGESDDRPPFTIHQFGASDLALPQHNLIPYDRRRLVPVRQFLAQVHDLMDTACGGADGHEWSGRDIVGITSFCGIPVPSLKDRSGQCLFSPDYDPSHHVAVLEIILPILKRRLMLGTEPTAKNRPDEQDLEQVRDEWLELEKQTALRTGRQRNKETWGALSAFDIGEKTRPCGLPQPLVRTLEFVYHNFTTLLANPFAFDSVLDLYDIFASFHRALTQELPKLCKATSPLENEKVDMIARLIDAVHRALGHRMYRLFPENSHRDMDIDFRGGLNALVYSADGISKLGAGVLRHHVLEHSMHDRARVGVVTRIGFRQGIFALAMRLGVESETRLGIVETDVPHLYHLPSYVDFLHEAFHLAYDAARNPGSNDPRPPMLPTVPRDDEDLTLDSRLAEVFANMLTALFVCPQDPEILAEHMVLQYTVRNARVRDKVVLGNFIELTCLLYIMCGSLETLRKTRAARTDPAPWWFCSDEKEEEHLAMNFDPDITAEQFADFFEGYLPYFSSFLQKNVVSTPSMRESLREQVIVIYDELYTLRLKAYVPMVAARVCLIFSRYWLRSAGRLTNAITYKDDGLRRATPHTPENLEEFNAMLRLFTSEWNAINDRLTLEIQKTVSGGPCKPFSFLSWRNPDPRYPDGRLDPMILLGVLLGETLRSRSADLKHGNGPRHLPHKAGTPSFKDFKVASEFKDRPRYFIQRGVSALFTSDFEQRARRLGSRIAMLKMFGDMAALLRSKRFSEMLFRSLSVKIAPEA